MPLLALETLPEFLQDLSDLVLQRSLLNLALQALWALMLVMFTRWAANLSGRLTRTFLNRLHPELIEPTLQKFLIQAAGIMVWLVGLVAALNVVGIQTTTIVAVVGAAGLAVGLALQNSLSHFAAGVLLISLRPFEVGDQIEGAGVAGTVDSIGVFSTNLITADHIRITVPNGNLFSSTVQNKTVMGTRRVDLTIDIGDRPIEPTISQLTTLVTAHPLVLKRPAMTCQVLSINLKAAPDDSTVLSLRPWCAVDNYEQARSEILQIVKLALTEQSLGSTVDPTESKS
jgi:small conductance mechanosensitive channel